MKIKSFNDLKVWQKAHELVLQIYSSTKQFPDDEKFGITNQIRRSAVSICANIVEGYMKSRKDFVRYLDISRGSLEETKYHLILCKDLKYFSSYQFEKLYNETEEIGKMIYSLKQSLCFKKYLTTDH